MDPIALIDDSTYLPDAAFDGAIRQSVKATLVALAAALAKAEGDASDARRLYHYMRLQGADECVAAVKEALLLLATEGGNVWPERHR